MVLFIFGGKVLGYFDQFMSCWHCNLRQEQVIPLNKGLQYSLDYQLKNWITILELEAETAISRLPTHEQEFVRH